MKLYQVTYNNEILLLKDNLETVRNIDTNDIASIWSCDDSGVWECENKTIPSWVSQLFRYNREYFPTKIIFFLTSRCNLDCKYCYSKISPRDYVLDMKNCKSVIDKMIQNLIKLNRRTLKIKFHGGGEPFVAFDLMKQVVEYAKFKSKEKTLKLNIDASTNGILTDEQRIWISQNINRLNISFDGTKELHKKNRPAKISTIDSYLELKKTVEFFDSISYPFTLRTTITETRSNNITKIISESRKLSKNAIKKLELVCEEKPEGPRQFQLGKSIDYLVYLNKYFQAKRKDGTDLRSFDACDGGYGQCGAWGDNLILDGLGNISTCFKYSALGRNSPFYVCNLEEFLNRQIHFNNECKILKVTQKAEQDCAYCFLWKKCGGGCLALRDENNFNLYCDLLRSFFITKIIDEQ